MQALMTADLCVKMHDFTHWALAFIKPSLMLATRGAYCAKRPNPLSGVLPEPKIHTGTHHGQSYQNR
jgi:hypothetical protein